jgi:hypothetical protein
MTPPSITTPLDAALIVRERIGVPDSLIHEAVFRQTIPLLLKEGEQLVKRPALTAGNDAGSPAWG